MQASWYKKIILQALSLSMALHHSGPMKQVRLIILTIMVEPSGLQKKNIATGLKQ